MADLDRQLRELGELVEFPAAPDLAPAVRARISADPRGRRVPWWSTRVAVAFAIVLVVIGAAFAVPPARTQILEWFGIGGVSVQRVATAPEPSLGDELRLGPEVTLAEARERTAFEILVPGPPLGTPDAVHITFVVRGGQVSYLYGGGDAALLITQFEAPLDAGLVEKLAGPGTRIESVTVNGGKGVWIEGEPHSFGYFDEEGRVRQETLRLAGNTLIWEQGSLTVRVEGAASKEEALELAASLR